MLLFQSASDMEFFRNAKVVRLRSHHDKYLSANEDGETVTQDKDGTATNARWTVEFVNHADTLRFKSCYGKYLKASSLPFKPGLRGINKVLQTKPRRLDSSLEWEPVSDGYQVRLRTPYGQFLCANGGVPPLRNSITHDAPQKTVRQDWILWDVDVLEMRSEDDTTNDDAESSQSEEPRSPPGDIKMPLGKRGKIRKEVKENVTRISDKISSIKSKVTVKVSQKRRPPKVQYFSDKK
ncbi:putative actin cross-linking [Rosa chinensis]|uniref:Putative actin cross-linking n=2 Tax=Rosa chinensis TaxID=74649 RepID=A0A2P6S4V9_ROSCH|nr:putative actin cross-linking [Rosa chinensis]